ncbi:MULTISPECIES: ABC transporter ATP-binding protein [unclassified Acinetobacter]|uniref:ABC transporter ATP-binding protein n=1 Tax=unclassified Acinetobacter TaxID=196816 RepID=UPI0035BA8688
MSEQQRQEQVIEPEIKQGCNDVLIDVQNLHFKRGTRVIYAGVDIQIRRGKITALMGPSGTGKTTLLRLIGGQLKPDQGQVLLDGQDIAKMSRKALFEARARMGMLFQSGALFTDMNVYENVAFPIRAHRNYTEAQIAEIVSQRLEAVGLRGAEKMMPSELSGGMNRRAALARAIALDPELVMYDEPFAGQDPIVMGVLARLVRSISESLDNVTTIIVSHDVQETLSIADYVYVVAEGKVQGEGTPEQLRQSSSAFVQQFLTGSPDGPVDYQFSSLPQPTGASV